MTHPVDPCPELEELAALLDGRLDGDERRRVVIHLDRCERCREIFAENVRFREEERPAGRVARHPAAGRGGGRWVAAGAVAAALAAAVWLPGALAPELPAADRVASSLVAAGASAGLAYDGSGWPVARGGGGLAGGRERLSFRLGVRTLDLALALAADDRQRAAALAGELRGGAGGLELAAPAEVSYADLGERLAAGEPTGELAAAAAAAERVLAEIAEPLWFRFGQWAETGRLAALGGDFELLGARAVRRFPRQLEDRELGAAVEGPLAEAVSLLERPAPEALPRLAGAFDRLLAAAGG